jgi:hypothetical protein
MTQFVGTVTEIFHSYTKYDAIVYKNCEENRKLLGMEYVEPEYIVGNASDDYIIHMHNIGRFCFGSQGEVDFLLLWNKSRVIA